MKNLKTALLVSALALFSYSAVAADAAKPAGTPVKPNRWLVKNDTNKDGKLSKQEFMSVHERYFNDTDTNKDGFLTSEEMKASADKKRAERRAARAKRHR